MTAAALLPGFPRIDRMAVAAGRCLRLTLTAPEESIGEKLQSESEVIAMRIALAPYGASA